MVVEGNGNEGTVEGFDSAQTVLGMTNTVTDIVGTTTDKLINGLFAPFFPFFLIKLPLNGVFCLVFPIMAYFSPIE